MIFGLVFVLLIAAPQQTDSTESQAMMQQLAHEESERHRQAAVRINNLAERIQSESDANELGLEQMGTLRRHNIRPADL